LVGEGDEEDILLRSGAREGDIIYVTGDLGASAAGLFCLRREKELSISVFLKDKLQKKHLLPEARVKEGRQIVGAKIASSMIDVSDGLASDLFHILEESKVGAELWEDRIPVSEEVKKLAGEAGSSFLNWALYGGEDYELLFTCSSSVTMEEIKSSLGFPVAQIGKIVKGEPEIVLIDSAGRKRKLEPKGWDHFSENLKIPY